jgi:hypothetical protein
MPCCDDGKVCRGPVCLGAFRPRAAFAADRKRSDGLQTRCRDCCAARYREGREERAEYARRRRELLRADPVAWEADRAARREKQRQLYAERSADPAWRALQRVRWKARAAKYGDSLKADPPKRRKFLEKRRAVSARLYACRKASIPAHIRILLSGKKRPGFALTVEWGAAQIEKQAGRCQHCRIRLDPSAKCRLRRPSLDRLIAGGEYKPENVVYACMACNLARGNSSIEDFYAFRDEQKSGCPADAG